MSLYYDHVAGVARDRKRGTVRELEGEREGGEREGEK